MWRAAGFVLLLLNLGPAAEAQFYSESGNNAWGAIPRAQSELQADPDSLARIVDELKALQNAEQLEADSQLPVGRYEAGDWEATAKDELNPAELTKIGNDLQRWLWEKQDSKSNLLSANENVAENSQPEEPIELSTKQPLTAQKKGQFEFVEFVEPQAAKALKNVEYMDKRAPISIVDGSSSTRQFIYGSNNVFFIVAVTVCSVAAVVGIVGGTYYFNAVRKQRAEAFDDFTRYSPAGPGRDMLRKGRGMAGSPIIDSGDHDLAKAAHLQHFEQTKQKILGEDNGINDDQSEKSDDEADDFEEHNFSIYECPGLAPTTGDIEVNNPSFIQQNP